ncbi:MAG: hypothetical protein COW08_06020 [Ignavibacteriales bacterium CG12_big_fil_rev_8_21_14_0_65_30_8]|nr:MAG: hypothetical protein COW08_06020 [Ignavibacteriales bacterium CG12_big_fil_rev_8_21_14_0_65_30_8]
MFYSEDFNLCLSLLVYLQNKFNVITTTNFDNIDKIAKVTELDLLFLDVDPDNKVESFCENFGKNNPVVPIIITYVYKSNLKLLDSKIRENVSSVFYKPYDLDEISERVTFLLET